MRCHPTRHLRKNTLGTLISAGSVQYLREELRVPYSNCLSAGCTFEYEHFDASLLLLSHDVITILGIRFKIIMAFLRHSLEIGESTEKALSSCSIIIRSPTVHISVSVPTQSRADCQVANTLLQTKRPPFHLTRK